MDLRARTLPTLFAIALTCALNTPARATDPIDARELIQGMADAVIGTLRTRADMTTRKAALRQAYDRDFDAPYITAWTVGPRFRQATPQQKRGLQLAVEDYVVAAYATKLARYNAFKLLIVGEERHANDLDVDSLIINRDPRAACDVQIKWRLVPVGGRLKVYDIVIDRISMLLTLRQEFTELMQGQGNRVADLIAALEEGAAAASDRN